MTSVTTTFLDRPDGQKIAYNRLTGGGPGLVWLSGFKSDMTGTKATALSDWAENSGRAFVRFDYMGHGASSGRFEDGTIGRWVDDALAVIDLLTEGPQILVGSSMGGWIALHCALKRPEMVQGLLLIAPAPDFTEQLMWPTLPDEAKTQIEQKGFWLQPSDYDDGPYPLTKELFEDGKRQRLLDRSIDLVCPVHILQGMDDPDVPWKHALKLVDKLQSRDVVAEFIKTGDHRLSRLEDIDRILSAASGLVTKISRP